jgi:hypothetical protein
MLRGKFERTPLKALEAGPSPLKGVRDDNVSTFGKWEILRADAEAN